MVCTVRPKKEHLNFTRITIGGNCIFYPVDVVTPTFSLEIFKLIVNSVLSRWVARYATFDIRKIYLGTPLNRPEYFKIRLSDIPQEFIDDYNLETRTQDVWVYFEIYKGVYALPQVGKLANDLLHKRFGTVGYYEAATTPGLWLHKWHPIIFSLIVDDFGLEYVEERHAKHLIATLEEHYTVTTDWK